MKRELSFSFCPSPIPSLNWRFCKHSPTLDYNYFT